VKNNPRIKIPIIGNGDVTTPERAKECFDKYGVDAVMIGRATFGNPWIFEEIKYYLKNGERMEKKPFEYYIGILKEHIEKNIEWLGEIRGIIHTRRHLASTPLLKGIDNFKQTRIAILRAQTKDELIEILDGIKEKYNLV
jgi:tRNA-dihydrouridine synthase